MTTESTSPATETTVEVNPAIKAAIDMLRAQQAAYANLPLNAQAKVKLADAQTLELVISNLASVQIRSGKVQAQHEEACPFWERNQPHNGDNQLITQEAYLAEKVAAVKAALGPAFTAGVENAITADVAALYSCNCPVGRAKGKGGNRSNPAFSGPTKVTVVSPTGETFESDSMSEAAKKVAAWYPDAKQAQKYVETINAKKAANARVFLRSDLKAGRLPATALPGFEQSEAPADETPSDGKPAE